MGRKKNSNSPAKKAEQLATCRGVCGRRCKISQFAAGSNLTCPNCLLGFEPPKMRKTNLPKKQETRESEIRKEKFDRRSIGELESHSNLSERSSCTTYGNRRTTMCTHLQDRK